jgi:Ca2+/Na+ antiporter
METNLLEKEVIRCNNNILFINILFLIFVLWQISYRLQIFDILFIVFLFLLLISIYYFYKLYERFSDFRTHPLYIRFLRFENPLKIGELIENELNNKVFFSQENKIITEQWLIERSFYDFVAFHHSEIIWIYPIETQHSLNFIPTSRTFSIKIHSMLKNTQNKMSIEISSLGGKENSTNCLILIQKFAPWALYGFNEKFKDLWTKEPDIMVKKVNVSYQQFFNLK